MKKLAHYLLIAVITMIMFSSCATVFGGRTTEYQRTPPKVGEPPREIRYGALVADLLLFWPGAIVDFATGAIYKPAPSRLAPPVKASSQNQ
jgi:hypothetical protein